MSTSTLRLWLFVVAILVAFGLYAWVTDTVTLQGERTVHTVDCRQGEWRGMECSGDLVATDRYRYRALRAHGEVLFWRVGVAEKSGKLPDCDIVDGRNWSCQPTGDAAASVILQLVHGHPVHDPSGRARPFHAVDKWRWWLLHWNLYAGRSADD